MTSARFVCRRCGDNHDGPPLAYGYEAPAQWSNELVGVDGNALGGETCELKADGSRHFFLRGRIRIPVIDSSGSFEWGVWVSLAEASYRRALARWRDPRRTDEPPYFGWLATSILVYPQTIGLKTNLRTQPVGERPLIELEPTDHPLAVEQRAGITIERVEEIASLMLHAAT